MAAGDPSVVGAMLTQATTPPGFQDQTGEHVNSAGHTWALFQLFLVVPDNFISPTGKPPSLEPRTCDSLHKEPSHLLPPSFLPPGCHRGHFQLDRPGRRGCTHPCPFSLTHLRRKCCYLPLVTGVEAGDRLTPPALPLGAWATSRSVHM